VICLLPESLDMALFMRSVSVSNIIRVDVSMEARPRRGDAAAMLARRSSRGPAARMPATEQSSILARAAPAPQARARAILQMRTRETHRSPMHLNFPYATAHARQPDTPWA
jgi:acyl-CoA reductase-like NAD-dependent aldehyde dehydrogenase